ncbi:MAG: tetratricopeptide repeat protein [Halobacteriota archaeon]|nr:tetratricopeptide repeat protein [Halobacteriota archaeon]
MSEEETSKTAEEWFDLGYNTEDPKEKIKYYTKVLEIDGKNVAAWYNKGLSYLLLEMYVDAIASFDKVLEIDSENVDAWHYKGIALDILSQCSDATACFEKAWELGMKDRFKSEDEE